MTITQAQLPDPILYAIPVFVGLIVIELTLLIRRRRQTAPVFGSVSNIVGYEIRDTITSLSLGVGSVITNTVFGLAGVYAGLAIYRFWHVFEIGINSRDWWWAWIVCFVLQDFAYYWFHRTAHRVRWFWASHVVHHSSQHYNLSTALRQTWTGPFSLGFAFYLPLYAIGFPPVMITFCISLNLVGQFWFHTEAVNKMPGWFEFIMNTPSHHRVHHAINPRYLDRNFGGVFIVWDRLFHTFEAERDDERCRYGLIRQIDTFNPLWAAFHEWIAIAADLKTARSWRARAGSFLGVPGWSRDGSRDTSDSLRARWSGGG